MGLREDKIKTNRESAHRYVEAKQNKERAVNGLTKCQQRLPDDNYQINETLADQSHSTKAIKTDKAQGTNTLQKLNGQLESVKSMLANANRDVDTMRSLDHKRSNVIGCIQKTKANIRHIETFT